MRATLVLFLEISLAGMTSGAEVDYQRDIKPLLAHKCAACHGALKQKAGMRLDAGVLILKGSDSGSVIEPGKASESLLIRRVSAADPDVRMPPHGEGEPLNEVQIALLSEWIDDGAIIPDVEEIPEDPRKHWAYQPLRRPVLPRVDDSTSSHPIDLFVASQHQRLGLKVAEQADRGTLLRRVYFDLLGLPPARDQLRQFLLDDESTAWSNVVDTLLESPHYGERWGRHWMDVWRYSDWDGYKEQLRGSQRHIWRWRDWIVQSLNADKGYDRMIVEMLAGDEIAPGDPSILPATGFLARNYHSSNRNIWLDSTVEHTAKAFLGMTLNCARCHDHKYDAIAQPEYYRFRAIFEPLDVRTDRMPGQSDVKLNGLSRVFDAELMAQTFLYRQGNEKHPDKEYPLSPAVPDTPGGRFHIQPVELPVTAYYPSIREFIAREDLADARTELESVKKELSANSSVSADSPDSATLELKLAVAELRVRTIEARQAADRVKYAQASTTNDAEHAKKLAHTAADMERQLRLGQADLTVQQRKDDLAAAQSGPQKDEQKKQAKIAAAIKVLMEAEEAREKARQAFTNEDSKYTPLGKEYPRTSSGRRLALARWITSTDNPLTARVAVNHIWLRHFGSPLVDNVFDFGRRTPRPRHDNLLDWLAVELMENNWSMKHLHRLIVTSRTWQLTSSASESRSRHNEDLDPDNHYLWRANIRRLEAEAVRDNLLAVSGQLDPTLGGPDIDYRNGEESRRRSIYLRHAYEKQMTMLVLFDAASPNECYRRSESIIPQQALALTNSSLSLGQSRLLARQLWKEVSAGSDETHVAFVNAAFLQILSRSATEKELTACLQFLDDQAATLSDSSRLTTFRQGVAPQVKPATEPRARARENLVHVLMNHNDFVTVR